MDLTRLQTPPNPATTRTPLTKRLEALEPEARKLVEQYLHDPNYGHSELERYFKDVGFPVAANTISKYRKDRSIGVN